jgi:hypothetical protein
MAAGHPAKRCETIFFLFLSTVALRFTETAYRRYRIRLRLRAGFLNASILKIPLNEPMPPQGVTERFALVWIEGLTQKRKVNWEVRNAQKNKALKQGYLRGLCALRRSRARGIGFQKRGLSPRHKGTKEEGFREAQAKGMTVGCARFWIKSTPI